MREIKFKGWIRCGDWDEEGEQQSFRMVDADSLAFEEFAPLKDLLVDIPDRQYLMQFTGLLDKRDQEIYENDIVKHGVDCYTVRWDSGAWSIKPGIWFSDNESKYFEIIGNLFETPELVDHV